uniref:Uncharacterized protein n=1 Tax=Lactuca sativa TaxID=4236 RepID=A0A9R1XXK0_LACSA|nr:hypothetical protein LSAT_V11C100040090 [Lactuca sativa]
MSNKRVLRSLKILNLSFCEQLRSLGGFDHLPVLEKLILRGCIRLLDVCESIEQCLELVFVDLSYCSKLQKVPRIIEMLKKVKTLFLDGCNLAVLEVIPNYSKFFTIYLPTSLVSLSLEDNNLFTESFPMDFSRLSMLKELYLDENPIVSLPNCVRSLPRLETLSMGNCTMLMSVEHPPHTLIYLNLFNISGKPMLQKVVFDPEMSPLQLVIDWDMLPPSSFEVEGMVKIQPMTSIEEKVLCSFCWTKPDFLNERHVVTLTSLRDNEKSEIQMYYEFGIFSTIYDGEEMPNWITDRIKGPSISFTIPSSPKNFTGLNFCYVLTSQRIGSVRATLILLPVIIISNIAKNRTWIYHNYIEKLHWMFGTGEMEAGDQDLQNVHV